MLTQIKFVWSRRGGPLAMIVYSLWWSTRYDGLLAMRIRYCNIIKIKKYSFFIKKIAILGNIFLLLICIVQIK